MPFLAAVAAGALAWSLAGPIAQAAMVASDVASNYTSTSWPGTANGGGTAALTTYSPTSEGYGFGAWLVAATNSQGPPYSGTYLDTSGKNIATSTTTAGGAFSSGAPTTGASWGVYANTSTSSYTPALDALRAFNNGSATGLGTLRSGQTFDAAFQTDGIGSAGQAGGLSLGSVSGSGSSMSLTPVFTFEYAGGGADDVTISDASGTFQPGQNGNTETAITFSDVSSGVNLAFTLNTASTYTLVVSPASGNTNLTSPVTYTGSISGALNGVDLFDHNATGNQYFNSLAIVPEPATLGLLAVGGVSLLIRRRRKA